VKPNFYESSSKILFSKCLLWDSRPGNDMVEEKTHYYVSNVFKCGHGFDPFGKISHSHYDVLVSITRWRIASPKIDALFKKMGQP
jgi:hypothetical protein